MYAYGTVTVRYGPNRIIWSKGKYGPKCIVDRTIPFCRAKEGPGFNSRSELLRKSILVEHWRYVSHNVCILEK